MLINLHSRQNAVEEGKGARETLRGTTGKRGQEHDYNYGALWVVVVRNNSKHGRHYGPQEDAMAMYNRAVFLSVREDGVEISQVSYEVGKLNAVKRR